MGEALNYDNQIALKFYYDVLHDPDLNQEYKPSERVYIASFSPYVKIIHPTFRTFLHQNYYNQIEKYSNYVTADIKEQEHKIVSIWKIEPRLLPLEVSRIKAQNLWLSRHSILADIRKILFQNDVSRLH